MCFCSRFSQEFCQICSLLVRMNCLTNFVSWIFFLFWSLSKIVQPCVAFFISLVEAAYWSQEETFEEKPTFLSKLSFFYSFWEFSNTVLVFGLKLLAGLSKLQLTCLQKHSEGIFLKMTFSHFRFSNGKSSAFWLNLSVRFVKLAFYFSIGTVWGFWSLFKTLFLKYFYLSSEKYLDNWQNFSGRLIKLHSKSSKQLAVNHKFPKLFLVFPIIFRLPKECFRILVESNRLDRQRAFCVSRIVNSAF